MQFSLQINVPPTSQDLNGSVEGGRDGGRDGGREELHRGEAGGGGGGGGGEEGMVLEGEAYKLMGLHPVVQSSLTLPQLKLSITSSLANCIQ